MLAAPAMVVEPALRPRPLAKVPLARSRKNWPPTEVLEPTAGESWNRAVPPRSTVVCEIWKRLSMRTPARLSR